MSRTVVRAVSVNFLHWVPSMQLRMWKLGVHIMLS